MHRIFGLALCAPILTAVPANAQVVTDHLLGKYSTTEDGCQDKATQDFEIRRGVVEGPNLMCILGATKPPERGTEAYEARCRQGGKGRLGTLNFDLSEMPARMKLNLPDSEDWIALYACR
jgi:hypothetical protein